MACRFIEGEKLDLRDAWDIIVSQVPLESGKEIVDLGDLGGMFPVAVLAVRERAELKDPGSAPVAII